MVKSFRVFNFTEADENRDQHKNPRDNLMIPYRPTKEAMSIFTGTGIDWRCGLVLALYKMFYEDESVPCLYQV
jgi:hypothetical protein